jgi:hypothetical protein
MIGSVGSIMRPCAGEYAGEVPKTTDCDVPATANRGPSVAQDNFPIGKDFEHFAEALKLFISIGARDLGL